MRSYGEGGVTEKLRALGGEVYGITSEPTRLARQAQAEWELDFETVGDPHHEISAACTESGFLELVVNTDTARFEKDENSPYRHPKGYFQPGVLVLSAEGRVLYRWRSRPTRENMGGATNRPTADYVFGKISEALRIKETAATFEDAALDENPEVDSRGMPWLLFIPLLISNGWFVKLNTFGQEVGGPSVAVRMKQAALRIPFFVAAWGVAFAMLPLFWVGAALGAWVGWMTPKIVQVNRQFEPRSTTPIARVRSEK